MRDGADVFWHSEKAVTGVDAAGPWHRYSAYSFE